MLLDAAERSVTTVTLSGGGLHTPRTLTARNGSHYAAPIDWQVSATYRRQAAVEVNRLAAAHTERSFWAVQLPIALAVIALLLAASAGRTLMRRGRTAPVSPANSIPKTGHRADDTTAKGAIHALH